MLVDTRFLPRASDAVGKRGWSCAKHAIQKPRGPVLRSKSHFARESTPGDPRGAPFSS